ncbi:hypothetical protein GW17_00052655 [Ensete ventricosum]|nr:hypothetical protein GW17_00052655 [Ensete ventricosum]RZS25448.1 hypothetical protein BHM03_00058648 [Ensete ventricosum]
MTPVREISEAPTNFSMAGETGSGLTMPAFFNLAATFGAGASTFAPAFAAAMRALQPPKTLAMVLTHPSLPTRVLFLYPPCVQRGADFTSRLEIRNINGVGARQLRFLRRSISGLGLARVTTCAAHGRRTVPTHMAFCLRMYAASVHRERKSSLHVIFYAK